MKEDSGPKAILQAQKGKFLPLYENVREGYQQISKRLSVRFISAAIATLFFVLIYRHLLDQAQSQEFVLRELSPLIDAFTHWGGRAYWFGGRPMFAPAVLILFFAFVIIVFYSFRERKSPIKSNKWPLICAIAFTLMYLIGGTSSFPLYVLGMLVIPAAGLAGQYLAHAEQPDSNSSKTSDWLLMAGILMLGLVLRFYQLDLFPRVYSFDEQLFAKVALELGERPLRFFSEPHIMKPHLLRIGAVRLAFSLLGVGLFQHRTVSVLEGALTIFLVYTLCRRLWGNRAGLFAAFLLAVDPWHIGYSRSGVHGIEGPLFLALLLLLIILAVRKGGKLNFALLGAATGATVYLYLSCLIMAPFTLAAAVLGRRFSAKVSGVKLLKEAAVMALACILVALPYFTLGRENIKELDNFYSSGGNFLTAAQDNGWSPAFMVFVNFWNGIEFMVNWSSRAPHPARSFYPNPIAIGFTLLGLGALLAMRKKFTNLLVLLWIPVSWLPVSLSYGFAERRLFATLVPIPAMLGGLLLARLWDHAFPRIPSIDRLRRLLVIVLLVLLTLISVYIVYADCDPLSGGRVHPRKVAEFIGSLPPDYVVLVTSRVKEDPFLLYLASYDRLKNTDREQAFSFVTVEALAPMAEKIAASHRIAVVTDPGSEEHRLLQKIKKLNPKAEITESESFQACLIR